MRPVFDPVWPWSGLGDLLSAAGPRAFGLALAVAGLALALPVARVYLSGRPARRLLPLPFLLALAGLAWLTDSLDPGKFGPFAALMPVLVVPPLLVGLSVAAYLATPGLSRGRRLAVTALRLLAFALAFLAILRPSVGVTADGGGGRVQLLIAVDSSRSMTVRDESRGRAPVPGVEAAALSRWGLVTGLLGEWLPVAERLEAKGIDVRWFRFDGSARDLDPRDPGEADGKRTDYGAMLRELASRRDPARRTLALLVVGDGADHGAAPALGELARWRGAAPVVPFACGLSTTTPRHNDLSITSILTEPAPFVPLKNKIRVRLTVEARGYEGRTVRFRLFLERPAKGPDGGDPVNEEKEEPAREVLLPNTAGNPVELDLLAPDQPGEYKLRVEAEPPGGGSVPLDTNKAETFVTVSREGVRVLLIDKLRDGEPQSICDALAEDARIRVKPVWLRGGAPAGGGKLFGLDDEPPDVVLIGDVTPEQVRKADPAALDRIAELVGRGTGLMMLGGYASFGNSDWKDTPLEPMLPVDLSAGGQDERETWLRPTEVGMSRAASLFKLDDRDPKVVWGRLPLQGRTVLRLRTPPRAIDAVLAETDRGEPLLVTQEYERGKAEGAGEPARVLAFGGDTTFRWVVDEATQRLHGRFWRQVVLWLARQENVQGGVWVKPDARRLMARSELGFQVGVRGKGGADLAGGAYTVEVTGPGGARTVVPVSAGEAEGRGVFKGTEEPGVYRVTVRGEAREPGGEAVRGETSARVTVFDQDVELLKPAADPEFLGKLARAGGDPGGEVRRVQDVKAYLERLADTPRDAGRVQLTRRPDWRGTGPSGFLAGFFVAFVAVVSGEWFLRRRWGLV